MKQSRALVLNMSSDSIIGGCSTSNAPGHVEAQAMVPMAKRGRKKQSGMRVYILVATESGGLWQGLVKKRSMNAQCRGNNPKLMGIALAQVTICAGRSNDDPCARVLARVSFGEGSSCGRPRKPGVRDFGTSYASTTRSCCLVNNLRPTRSWRGSGG